MEVNLEDVRVMLMAIMRLNDGKTFIENEHAPLPQSEGEIGFRDEKSGLMFLRNDELPKIQKHFNALYINQMQIYGRLIEQQRKLRIEEKIQRELEEANPKITNKSKDLAAKYRAKQLAEINSQDFQNQSAGQD